MKNMGDMRREIKALQERVATLESQVTMLIDTFCKDAFEDFEAPTIHPEDVDIDNDDMPPFFGFGGGGFPQ